MKLTGCFVVEIGVVNRNSSTRRRQYPTEYITQRGRKVFFSSRSYKASLWNYLIENNNWSAPIIYEKNGEKIPAQKYGTIIDSEIFDLSGTVVDSPFKKGIGYSRTSPIAISEGKSVSNFDGVCVYYFSLIPREIGYQEIPYLKTNINNDDDIPTKIRKLYEALRCVDNIKDRINGLAHKVKDIKYYPDKNKSKVIIELTTEEKIRRIRDLLFAMKQIRKRVNGEEKSLAPTLAVFSVTCPTPAFQMPIMYELEKIVKKEETIDTNAILSIRERIEEFGQNIECSLLITDIHNYDETVTQIINQIQMEFQE